ncbi:MAG: hypothetical protein M1438_00855 [Deltaproteobacteria bacterium]|nr:hypothetical protein [Deltaproteobacteria bacterium]
MAKELTLAYEWEVLLLYTFSIVGKVVHEKDFGGRRKVDIYFETYEDPKYNFVAEITTISDKGLDQNNPIEAFSNEVYKIVGEYGLSGNSFHIQVGGRKGPTCKGEHKVELKLPGRARFSQTILNKGFRDFLKEVINSPNSLHHYNVNSPDAAVMIKYDPNQRFASGNYPSYKEMIILTENPIYDALNSKVSQLIDSNFNGHLGIFLCDGGSELFAKKPAPWFSYSIGEVINHFLSNNEAVKFVVTFTTKPRQQLSTFSSKHDYVMNVILYEGLKFDEITFDIREILKKVIKAFPKPETFPLGALKFLEWKGNLNKGRSHFGGMELGASKERTRVKVSARALLELLAGDVDQKKFFQEHGFIPSEFDHSSLFNPFSAALKRGELIKNIILEESDSQDDDWITFELKGPDPAISPYVVPTTNKKLIRRK